eukprot:scaffold21268_cov86-Skeletonema_marinoi.AAC.3
MAGIVGEEDIVDLDVAMRVNARGSSNRCQVMTDANGVAAAIEADLLDAGGLFEMASLSLSDATPPSTFDVDDGGRREAAHT